MKKILAILLIILISATVMGCSVNTSSDYREEVKINLPKDDTVNGYRLKAPENNAGNTVSANQVTVESKTQPEPKTDSTIPSDTKALQYCANTNSRVFHTTTCGSAKNIKEENKYITSSRDELIADGYTPCGKCNP